MTRLDVLFPVLLFGAFMYAVGRIHEASVRTRERIAAARRRRAQFETATNVTLLRPTRSLRERADETYRGGVA